MSNYIEKNKFSVRQPLKVFRRISLEYRKQYNTLIEKLLNQIIIHKRYTSEIGLKKIKELEAKAGQIVKICEQKMFHIKNKLKLSKLLEIEAFINQELSQTISTKECLIQANFKELNYLSQEAAYLFEKKNYTEPELIDLKQLLSRDISESESNIFKKINKTAASYEKIYINALLYFSPQISSDFLKSQFGITTEYASSSITFIVMPDSCDYFVSGSSDGTIRIWNLKTRLQEFVFYGHEGPITALILTKNGKVAISGSADNTIIIWNLENRSLEKHLKDLSSPIKKLELMHDEKYFLSLSNNGTLKMWDLASLGEADSCILSLKAIKFNLFNDRYSIILWEKNYIFYKNIQEPSNENYFTFENLNTISTLKISNSNKFILLVYGKQIKHHSKVEDHWESIFCCFHEYPINDLAISSNDDFFLTTSQDCRLRYWALPNHNCKRVFDKLDFSMSKLLISQDNNLALTYSSSIGIWNIKLGINEYSFDFDKVISDEFSLSSNSKFIILGRKDGSISILDIAERSLSRIKYHSIKPHCICFSEDKTLVVTGSTDKTVIAWKIKTGEILTLHTKHTTSINCLCINKNNSLIASGSIENVIVVWDMKQKNVLAYLYGPGAIRNLIFLDKSTYIAGSSDEIAYIWNYSTKTRDITINDLTADVDQVVAIGNLLAAASKNEIVIFNINEKKTKYKISIIQVSKILAVNKSFTIMAIGASNNKLMLWDIQNDKHIELIKKYSIPVCAVVTEKNKLIIPSEKKNSLVIFDIFANKVEFLLNGHKSEINVLVLSADENILVSGSNDNTIIIWSLVTRRKEAILNEHTQQITSLFFTRDGVYLVSGSFDNNVRLWDLESNKNIFENCFNSAINSISITSDNRFLFVGLQNFEVKSYDFELAKMKILTSFVSPVTKVEVTKNDKYAIFVAEGFSLKVWNIRKDCIEIIYTSKEKLLNSFVISKDNLFIYVPSNLSGIAKIKLKNDFATNKNSGFKQSKILENIYEVEFTDDIIYDFIKIYDADSLQKTINQDSVLSKLFSNYFYKC